jgi:hypothetical protein
MTYLGRIERFIGRKFTLAACKGLAAPEARPPKQTGAAGHPNAQRSKKKKFYRGHRKGASFKKAGAA